MISLNKMQKTPGLHFNLHYYIESDEKDVCRYCRKRIKNGEEVYVCPGTKMICCWKCRDQDNEEKHARKYYKKPEFKHIHYYALYKKIKKEVKEE